MYEKFYGLKENPFSTTPDPKFFFPSSKHAEALDSLIYTVCERRGFAVITGDIGCGKTTVCRTLLNRLERGTKVAMLTNPPSTSQQLLSSILEDLGITIDGRVRSNFLSGLKKYLIEQLSLDFNVVLIIDEAQNLNTRILEEIRLLSNLETEKKKMLQIILTGQPELKDKLKLKELVQLRQRINVQYHILPLSRKDTENYINHRLRISSINGDIQVGFSPEAIDEIYVYSQGIPRIINILCNSALLIGYATETKQITAQLIREAREEFGNDSHLKLQQETNNELHSKGLQLEETENNLKQLHKELEQIKEEKEELANLFAREKVTLEKITQQLQVTQESLTNCESIFHDKKEELRLCQSEIGKKRAELDKVNKELQAAEETLINTQNSVSQKKTELDEQNQKLAAKEYQLQETESRFKQLNEELQKTQAENSQLKLQQETIFLKLKTSQEALKADESAITEKQIKLEQINKSLESRQNALSDSELKYQQKQSELEQITQQLENANNELHSKGLQLEETENNLKQLHKELEQLKEEKEKLQAELDRDIALLKEELKNLQEEKFACHQVQEKLNQAWLEHQLAWQKRGKKILEDFKFIYRPAHYSEKPAIGLTEKSITKLKAKKPGVDAAVLTASTFGSEIKTDPLIKDNHLNPVYNGIRIFHRNPEKWNYTNFIFSAKGSSGEVYFTVFKVELKNCAMKIGKHFKVEIAGSWQKVKIPLAEFSKIINFGSVSELSLSIDYDVTVPDRVIYINNMCFSN